MRIAYYEENNYHTEIMGGFLQYAVEKSFEVTVYNSADRSSTVQYFQKFCKFDIKPHNELINEYEMYDKIIIGSSSHMKDFVDKIEKVNYNKFIFVCHVASDINPNYKNVIVLTPLNRKISRIGYMLPIHSFIDDVSTDKKNVLTVIGRFVSRDTNDLIRLITTCSHFDFVVHTFFRLQKFVPDVLINLSKKYPDKLKIFVNTKSVAMDTYLKNSKFILPLAMRRGWYHKDHLSGSIALAYNYNIPLIMDTVLQKIYSIEPCIAYTKSIVEVIEKVTTMREDQYQTLVADFIKSKMNIINLNNKLLDKII